MVAKHTAANDNASDCFSHMPASPPPAVVSQRQSLSSEQINILCNCKEVTASNWTEYEHKRQDNSRLRSLLFVNLLTDASLPPLNSMPIDVNEELTGPLLRYINMIRAF